MLYSPEELPEEIEDFSLAEAEIHVGRFRWLDVVMRRWANQLESTLFDHLHSVFEIEVAKKKYEASVLIKPLLHTLIEYYIYFFWGKVISNVTYSTHIIINSFRDLVKKHPYS